VNPSDLLISFSLALYSTWFYHKPTRCLFDAGEGVATALGKRIFAIRHIFLSHGHEDHVSGLANLVNARNLVAGDQDKPLNLYYPRHDPWIAALLEYIEKKQSGLLRYPFYVQPVEPGDEIEIGEAKRPTRVSVFETTHAPGRLCLGFEIEEERKVLDDAGQAVYKLVPIFFYSGDGFRARRSPYGRIELAVHEATFLERDAGEAARRIGHRHCTVESAIGWGASEDAKALVLCHVSDRYSLEEIASAARAAAHESKFRGGLYVAHRDLIIPLRSEQQSGATGLS